MSIRELSKSQNFESSSEYRVFLIIQGSVCSIYQLPKKCLVSKELPRLPTRRVSRTSSRPNLMQMACFFRETKVIISSDLGQYRRGGHNLGHIQTDVEAFVLVNVCPLPLSMYYKGVRTARLPVAESQMANESECLHSRR